MDVQYEREQDQQLLFSVVGLQHDHIYGMCAGLIEAGAKLKYVFEEDIIKRQQFLRKYPSANIAETIDEILNDESIHLVASAAIPSKRSALGIQVMEAGKDYFTAKAPFTQIKQLIEVQDVVKRTNQKYMVYFNERIHVESAVYVESLIREGEIGRIVQITGFGPHRLNETSRPSWFFDKSHSGGIICDIGIHQIEQFLHYTMNENAEVLHSKVGNYHHGKYKGFEDYGDATLIAEDRSTLYFNVDWLTPDGLSSWGDGRVFIKGSKGTIEIRKNLDVTKSAIGDHIFLVTQDEERYINVSGKIGFPFFKEFIADCIHRTENAMTQRHVFNVSRLALLAQENAEKHTF